MIEKKTRRPICIDLFAGAGGLALGFEQAGFDVVAAVEYDPVHAAIHKLNFPDTSVLCRDVRSVTGSEIREAAGIGSRAVDVVIGGPPCQGFSMIGHRVLDDPRNNLVFHYVRLVDELRPRAFAFENVAGMATGAHHRLLDELIERFQKIGYNVRLPYRILNASHYGVPQSRRRLILLGSRRGTKTPEYPAPTTRPAGAARLSRVELELDLDDLPLGPTVADAILDLPDIEGDEELWTTDLMHASLTGGSRFARILRGAAKDPTDFSYPRKRAPGTITGCLRAEHTPLSRRRFRETVPGTTEPISRFLRLPAEGLCNTLRAGTASDHGAFTSPRPIHPTLARCISVREAARLHSYPDWFRFHRTIWHGFRQIGNSVPPLLGRAIAASSMSALGHAPVKPSEQVCPGDEKLASMTMKQAAAYFGVSSSVIPSRTRSILKASA